MIRRQFETPEEFEDYLKTQLGNERGSLFFRLKMEVNTAYDKWVVLKDLMEHSTIIALSTALPFFHLTEATYWASLLMDITRLTEKSRRGKNDSIFSLSRHLDEPDSTVVHNWAMVAKKKVAPLRKVRDKRIAHSDNAVATGKRALTVTKIDITDLRNALDSIAEVLEVFYFRIMKPDSPISMIRTRGWHTSFIEGSVNKLNYLMVNGDENLRPQFEFNEKITVDEGSPYYTPSY